MGEPKAHNILTQSEIAQLVEVFKRLKEWKAKAQQKRVVKIVKGS